MKAAALVVLALLGCGSKETSTLSATDREQSMVAAKQCTDAVDTLAPSYQMVGPKLAKALQMDRTEAQRLMRDSIELLISTRELLCNVSLATVQQVLDKAPRDDQTLAAHARVTAAVGKLAAARKAYDLLLGAASSVEPPTPADEAAALERFQRALLGN
jgi:hypothetical protein